MKRYDLELTATGQVMEERKEGAYVTFSEVEQLQAKVYALLEERNSTGIAISNAILSGIVPDRHPLRSRLELLANHHKRELMLAELLRRARRYVSPLSCPESEIQIVQSIVSSIDSVLAGKLPGAWLPIETAPHDGRKALVYRPLAENSGDERIAVKRLTGGRSNSCWDKTVPPGETPCNPTDGACHVTHWMPLPDEPAQQGGEPCAIASPSSSPA